MSRKFKTVDYEASLNQQVSLRECLPPGHPARFIARVITELDLQEIYGVYGSRGEVAIAPEVLLGLLFYGYATGVFSSRKIEQATYESIPIRFLSGNWLCCIKMAVVSSFHLRTHKLLFSFCHRTLKLTGLAICIIRLRAAHWINSSTA